MSAETDDARPSSLQDRLLANPPAARRWPARIATILLPNLCYVAILFGWWWQRFGRVPASDFPVLLGLVPGGLAALVGLAWYLRDRRLRRRLVRSHGCMCVRCAQPLDSLGSAGACPSCGLRFERDRTVQAWIDSRLYEPPSTPPPAAR